MSYSAMNARNAFYIMYLDGTPIRAVFIRNSPCLISVLDFIHLSKVGSNNAVECSCKLDTVSLEIPPALQGQMMIFKRLISLYHAESMLFIVLVELLTT